MRFCKLLLWLLLCGVAAAQVTQPPIKSGTTLPATCSPTSGSVNSRLFWKTTGTIGLYECSAVNTWVPWGTGTVSGATTSLDNLASTAVNVSLLPATAGAVDLGSAAKPFGNLYVGGAASNNTRITGTVSSAHVFTLPDADSNPVQPWTGAASEYVTGISSAGVISHAQPASTDLSDTISLLRTSDKHVVSGVASLNASVKVVEDPANATTTPTASKIPIADGSGYLDSWLSGAVTRYADAAPAFTNVLQAAGFLSGDGLASDSSTTNNKLAKLSGGNLVAATTGDTNTPVVIIAQGGGTALVYPAGVGGSQANCVFDGATTASHYVGVSSSAAAECTDLGASVPAGKYCIGQVLTTNGGGGTYAVQLGQCPEAGPLPDPGSNGIITRTAANTTSIASAANVYGLWSGSGYMKMDGTADTPSSVLRPNTTFVQVASASGGGTTPMYSNCSGTNCYTTAGTAAAVAGSATERPLITLTSAATTASRAYTQLGTSAGGNPRFSKSLRGQAYGWFSEATAQRTWVVFSDCAAAGLDAVNPACGIAGFRTIPGTDTNWTCYLATDATHYTTADSGIAQSTTAGQKFEIWMDDANTTVHFYIAGAEVCAAISQANRPTSTTNAVSLWFYTVTEENVAKVVKWSYTYMETSW